MSNKNETILLREITKFTSREEAWDPFTWFKQMREENPIFYDEQQDVWNVFLYDHVKQVLSDHQLFSNKKGRSSIPFPRDDSRTNVNFCDPPEHRKRRALLAKAFTPRSLDEWKPRIESIADALVDDMAGLTNVDIVDTLAAPLPIVVIADLLGAPAKDRELFRAWSNILFLPYAMGSYDEIAQQKAQAIKEFQEYLYPIVLEKRKHPEDDIISDLIRAELDGERLTDIEVVNSSLGLLAAGNETTTMLISNIFYSMLVDQPGIYQELRTDVTLVPKLIEEVLRFRFPIAIDRRIAQDTTVFGHEMKQDQMIVAWVSSANRDASKFDHAENFNIHRANNHNHLSFGISSHFCLGAPLVRLEATFALTSFINRFSDIRLHEEFKVTDHLTDSISLKSFPISII
ncbi:cytochrome P450 [Baia soyae]|uniref:Cytochrome P450 n=1 Tax=Baia soyae TaxID=1544746 RepID=A0A4R2RT49_9BACL|nr:cytochrome P450 [Baia soyae]TCP66474.1 hypothetical protein EDD57_12311 [Baia soyae]